MKTLQIQGSESEESCQYLSKLLKQHTKRQESTVTKSTNAMAKLSTIPNRTELTEEKPNVTEDSDCYSFCSKSEYEYSFTKKNDYHFSELLADNLSTNKHPHRSPENISNNFGTEIKNIWSAINTVLNRNIETGKFFISLITEEREKSKYLETELIERSIEVEKLKAEIKLMKFVNKFVNFCSDPPYESDPSNEYSLLGLTLVMNSIFLDPSYEVLTQAVNIGAPKLGPVTKAFPGQTGEQKIVQGVIDKSIDWLKN